MKEKNKIYIRQYIKGYEESKNKQLFIDGVNKWRENRLKFIKDHKMDENKDETLNNINIVLKVIEK